MDAVPALVSPVGGAFVFCPSRVNSSWAFLDHGIKSNKGGHKLSVPGEPVAQLTMERRYFTPEMAYDAVQRRAFRQVPPAQDRSGHPRHATVGGSVPQLLAQELTGRQPGQVSPHGVPWASRAICWVRC